MITFESQHLQELTFQQKQIDQFLLSARHDLKIAEESDVPDVIFKFSCDALIKPGIMLIAKKCCKARSTAGHHIKILEKLSQLLKDEDIVVLGNKMRQERSANLYDGGIFMGEKDSLEYLEFVKSTFKKAGI